ncbi:MAG: MTH938/NDUFAF3 family protein [Pseudomonadota bacterium]
MHFTEDQPSGNHIINEYAENSVTINNQQYHSSLYLSADRLISDLPIESCMNLNRETLQFIFDIKPELVILGTGPKQTFPHPSIIGFFAEQKIGLEIMNHASACRTYAILSAEQRSVGMLLIIDSKK